MVYCTGTVFSLHGSVLGGNCALIASMLALWAGSCVQVAFFGGICVLIGYLVEFWGCNLQSHFRRELFFERLHNSILGWNQE